MPYNPQHHRRSIRLKGYDYTTPGAYYVTICTAAREAIFGQISASQMALSIAGRISATAWRAIPHHTPHVSLDEWIIMPDHLHGIIVIHRRETVAEMPGAGRSCGTLPGSLPAIVQNFKAVSARRINKLRGTPGQRVWQEDYYEHIVRNEDDLARIRQYIATNPIRWRG